MCIWCRVWCTDAVIVESFAPLQAQEQASSASGGGSGSSTGSGRGGVGGNKSSGSEKVRVAGLRRVDDAR